MRGSINDDRRFFDLTATISESPDYIFYHRLDRLALTLLPRWGTVRIGRQAVTWGNGLIFNPMDLFNPFAPTDVERDYKVGDDMIAVQTNSGQKVNIHFLYVPRRDPQSGSVETDQSSLAGKLHVGWRTAEFDIMAAKHYQDNIVGIGSTGYLGAAAWRLDATWTFLNEESSSDDYLSLVANMDYSWMWWQKNFYGFLEFFYCGLGEDNYTKAVNHPDILERLTRGELFTLGKRYLSGTIQLELHPLFNLFLTGVHNLSDPSGIIQPWAIWNTAPNFEITFGGMIYYGGKNTEYGGFRIPNTDFLYQAPDSVYLWLTYYF